MKQVVSDGRLWQQELSKGVFSLGVTEEHANAMGVVWVLVPVDGEEFNVGEVFAHYESSKGLGGFRAPFKMEPVRWNHALVEMPDKLTPHQSLVTVKAL